MFGVTSHRIYVYVITMRAIKWSYVIIFDVTPNGVTLFQIGSISHSILNIGINTNIECKSK